MEEHLTAIGSKEKPYGVQYMKQKFEGHVKDKIIFTDIAGKRNVVTFRTTASAILYDYYNNQKHDCEETEAVRLIETAAKLIKNDIRAIELVKSVCEC